MKNRRRWTLGLLLAGLLLAVGTPVYLALTLGLETYLFHPALLIVQAIPYLLAAALWLPARRHPATAVGQVVAGMLCGAALLLYVPMLTGLVPMGGDMVGLAFVVISSVTTLALLVVTACARLLVHLFWHAH